MISTTAASEPTPRLIVVVGPTGVGKTRISLELARSFSGEIVNGDATAMYRYLNIGSAKPALPERCEIPHHLIDIATPDAIVTVAQYQRLAYGVIDDVLARKRCPFLVGGSGLYIRAITEGYRIPPVPPNEDLRQALARVAEARGSAWLHSLLSGLDPVAAARIDERNIRRVIRAIEVCMDTGKPISDFWTQRGVRYDSLIVGLTRPLKQLFACIDLRVDLMLQRGLVDEVRSILDMGYSAESPALSAIGYRETIRYLQGDIGVDSVADEIRHATRRLARRQLRGWFRLDDPKICWFDVSIPDAVCRIRKLLLLHGLGERDQDS